MASHTQNQSILTNILRYLKKRNWVYESITINYVENQVIIKRQNGKQHKYKVEKFIKRRK